jgi:hypothetical protein
MSNKKRTALAGTIERRKERKQFCAFYACARFHTAWVKSCPNGPEVRLPLYPESGLAASASVVPVTPSTAICSGLPMRVRRILSRVGTKSREGGN